MKSAFAAAVMCVLVSTIPAFAVGLTDADFEFLATQNVERNSSVLRGLSPRELARLHALINDLVTSGDQVARKKAVERALQEFRAHQAWEQANPGQLWDVRRK